MRSPPNQKLDMKAETGRRTWTVMAESVELGAGAESQGKEGRAKGKW